MGFNMSPTPFTIENVTCLLTPPPPTSPPPETKKKSCTEIQDLPLPKQINDINENHPNF